MKTTTINLRANSHIATLYNALKNGKSQKWTALRAKMLKAGVKHVRTLTARLSSLLRESTGQYIYVDYDADTIQMHKMVKGVHYQNTRASRAGIKRATKPAKTVSKKSSKANRKQTAANAKAKKQVKKAVSRDELLEVA